MLRVCKACLLISGTLGTVAAQAQDPLSADTQFWYETIKKDVVRAAQKMPKENYSFKPVTTVRTFGQIIGHIADDQYFFCSLARGEKVDKKIEKTVTSKEGLVGALEGAFSYCDAVYQGLTDAEAVKKIKTFAGDRTTLSWLSFNYAHTYEHYGNIVTYMRIKGLVPPSSEKQP